MKSYEDFKDFVFMPLMYFIHCMMLYRVKEKLMMEISTVKKKKKGDDRIILILIVNYLNIQSTTIFNIIVYVLSMHRE